MRNPTTENAAGRTGMDLPPAPDSGLVRDVDARGLEPPGPLLIILEALAELPAGGILRAHTDRRPTTLLALLAERGSEAEAEARPDGSFLTFIRGR